MAGGLIFRLVTPNHPGEPSLDDPCLSIQFRKEYVCADAPGWTTDRDKAHVYPTYDIARTEAAAMGDRCHAAVVPAPEETVPERLRPVPDLQVMPPPLAYPSKKNQRPSRVSRASRDWVKETYG